MYLDQGVGVDVYKRTDRFEACAGERITVSFIIEPEDVTIRMGIQELDGTLRYVQTSGSVNHTFAVHKDGDYRVFVQNISKTHYVAVSGSYFVR